MVLYLANPRTFLRALFSLSLIATLSITAMAQALPPKTTFTIPGGPTYAYVYCKAQESKPTFLLLHGFPSSSFDWHNQISALGAAGYGVLAPDMLGYGGTDKPSDVESYAHSTMSAHVSKILDHEGLTHVIGVGHDWGSALLGKVWNYYPQYFSSLVFMSVPYTPPSTFDLDSINAMTKAAFGYETYGYMYFFNETDAGNIITPHSESLLSLIYPNNSEIHKTELCPRGKVREWIEADKMTPLPSWEPQQVRDDRIKLFAEGGWTGPTNWYKAVIRNIDADVQSQIPQANYAITKPVIFMGGDIDYVTRPELAAQIAEQGKQQGWLSNVTFKTVTGGSHWMMLEQPDQIFSILDELAKSL